MSLMDFAFYTAGKKAWDQGVFLNESPEFQAAMAQKLQDALKGSQEVSTAAKIAKVLPFVVTPVIAMGPQVFAGWGSAGTAMAPSGLPYITDAGLPASLQVPAGMGVTASGLPYITEAGLPASMQAPAAITAAPSLLDKIWTAGKDMGGLVSAALGYGKELQQILSPVFQTQYPTVADSTGAAEYTKLADQGIITGFTMPGEVTPGETGPNTLYIIGGIVLLFLLMRRVKR